MSGKKQKKEVDYTEPKENKVQVVDFTVEVSNRERQRNLAEIAGQTILIYDFNIQETRLGPRLEITAETPNGIEKFYTYSRVIIDQIRRYKDALGQGKALRARIEKRKRYLSLAPP